MNPNDLNFELKDPPKCNEENAEDDRNNNCKWEFSLVVDEEDKVALIIVDEEDEDNLTVICDEDLKRLIGFLRKRGIIN